MISKKTIKYLSLILILFAISCNEKEQIIKTIYTNPCYLNNNYVGKIIPDLALDTITINKNNTRSTALFLGKFNKQYKISDLEKMHKYLDTFVNPIENSNDTIYFDYKFDKTGTFYLDGYIQDLVLLKNYYPDGKARIITDFIKFSKEIKVIERK
jgi:hypothetical protein